jgi:hypothetical protein
MHEIKQIKDMLMEELKELTKKGELTAGSLETVDKLLNSIKNACKITMYDEYQGEDYSYEGGNRGGYSRARGRGSDAMRDSRGRYSSEGYSSRRYSRGDGYSYGSDSEEIIEALREAMEHADTEQEKTTIRKMIRRMEQG